MENPGKESGWLPESNRFCYSTCGYEPGASKKAVLAAGADTDTFTIEDRKGQVCLEKCLENVAWRGENFQIADFSELTQEGE